MTIQIDDRAFFIFDLDDTLFPEYNYLQSAYKKIADIFEPKGSLELHEKMCSLYRQKINVFDWLLSTYGSQFPQIRSEGLLKLYREHEPEISLDLHTRDLLFALKENNVPLGLITDGRAITQRNKLRALKIADLFDDIIISEEFGSEKPDEKNFLFFENKYPGKHFYFFGDNTGKDFIVPLRLGWQTFCVRNSGINIHPQSFTNFSSSVHIIKSLGEIKLAF